MKTYEQLYDENGNYKLDENYTEILKLDKMLTEANIPHTLNRFFDGWVIVYPSEDENMVADAIQHCGSYGNTENLLEIMGLIEPEETSDCVLGNLSAEDVFNRVSRHYEAHKNEKGGEGK